MAQLNPLIPQVKELGGGGGGTWLASQEVYRATVCRGLRGTARGFKDISLHCFWLTGMSSCTAVVSGPHWNSCLSSAGNLQPCSSPPHRHPLPTDSSHLESQCFSYTEKQDLLCLFSTENLLLQSQQDTLGYSVFVGVEPRSGPCHLNRVLGLAVFWIRVQAAPPLTWKGHTSPE